MKVAIGETGIIVKKAIAEVATTVEIVAATINRLLRAGPDLQDPAFLHYAMRQSESDIIGP